MKTNQYVQKLIPTQHWSKLSQEVETSTPWMQKVNVIILENVNGVNGPLAIEDVTSNMTWVAFWM